MGSLRTLPPKVQASTFFRFGTAFVAAVIALLVSGALNHFTGTSAVYLTPLAAVAFSSWYCGIGPSIMCAALSLLGVELWIGHPGWPGAFAFLFASAVIVVIAEADRRERSRLSEAAGKLEENVRERTRELDRTNQSLRELTARLLNLQDEERRRIARELHDNAGQALSVLAMNLGAVANDLGRLVNTVHTVKDSASLVKQMSDDIRTMSYLLHPPLLDEMGLASALRWYLDGFAKRSKISVDFDCPENLGRLSREVETAVFRLVQECLTNILRHSGSPTATVQVALSDGHLRVDVRDMGRGISLEQREQMESAGTVGVGIRGMRERVKQLGGRLEITSNGVGSGTRVFVQLPAVVEPACTDDASTELAS